MDLKGKNVLVCGMAKSGISAALLLKKLGANVTLQDIKENKPDIEGITFYLGKNPDEIIKDMDLVVVSPGIPTHLPFFNIAKENNVKIISEVELSYLFTPCKVAAITGTNGKTTTTALTGEIFKRKYNTKVVGNIGIPYSQVVLDLEENSYVVAEISSFQMETAEQFMPHISAVLNVTPDHLDRHKTMECYAQMKERVLINQKENDFVILNYDDEYTRNMAEKTKAKVFYFSSTKNLEEGIYLENNNIFIKWGNIDEVFVNVKELKILGTHNYENAMAAIAISICADIDLKTIKDTLLNFRGVEHRIEFVKTVKGVDYFNDSKGTNTDAAIRGILAMVKPCILIGGGYDKKADYSEWVEKFDGRVKKLILIGETADSIISCCNDHGFTEYEKCETFEGALNRAKEVSVEGDCVLLSPACASWGMFDNYEQRGDIFKEIVFGF
ncbi:MAG: UDP-N-acetylmuramoyl-L-alanine--D-glutamate ligase [Anaerotignaceae bacterium]